MGISPRNSTSFTRPFLDKRHAQLSAGNEGGPEIGRYREREGGRYREREGGREGGRGKHEGRTEREGSWSLPQSL